MISLVIDQKLPPEKTTLIVSKLQNLKPKNFRIDYKLSDDILNPNVSIDYSSVDVIKSIQDFVNTLDVQYKENVVNYLNDLYNTLNK